MYHGVIKSVGKCYLAYGERVGHHLYVDLRLAGGQVVGGARAHQPRPRDHLFRFQRHFCLYKHPGYVL